jgi:hypothetical protein
MRRVLLFAVLPLSLLLSPLAILYTFTSIDRYGYTYAHGINDSRLRG